MLTPSASTASPASTAAPESSSSPLTRAEELILISHLLDGQAAAWKAFHAAYGRLIATTIGRVVGRFGIGAGSEDAREIQASLCLELLANDKSKLRAFDPARGARFSTWIAMLASHAAYDFLRRRRREPRGDGECDADLLACDSPDPHTLCELGERARLVESLTHDFSAKDRQFLDLYFAQGLEPDEVANRMGISVKTVYSKKHKIRGRIEALLGRRQMHA
jgi:RNA polymerase sigma-70 factor (ECF subfamily)